MAAREKDNTQFALYSCCVAHPECQWHRDSTAVALLCTHIQLSILYLSVQAIERQNGTDKSVATSIRLLSVTSTLSFLIDTSKKWSRGGGNAALNDRL